MNIRILLVFSALLPTVVGNVYAAHYTLPENSTDTVITEYPDDMPLSRSEKDETLLDVARRYSLGQTEILRLNPELDRWNVKKGEIVRISNKHILPDSPHDGITLNISEYRMYYYPPAVAGQPRQIMSYAHGVGRQDWKTPLGKTSVAKKVKDPSWHPPESIRKEHAALGDPLPEIVPPGPHNPLGAYALYLNLPGDYRIHGTDIDKIFGIGMQITHGCVRMYPENVEELYNLVAVGTPVYIVKQPIKVGWLDNVLYIEAHPDLEGEELSSAERYGLAMELIQKANNQVMPDINQAALDEALKNLTGDPIAIFERIAMPTDELLTSNPTDPLDTVAPVNQGMPINANDATALKPPVNQMMPMQAPGKKSLIKKPSYPADNYYSPRNHSNSL
ncbi:MAG: L,D-transpeptidase family protein [Methylococcaceae bacterium]|nr:L,D-transpeptidase family protein [Methylococcaceae bacterium]